MKRFFVFALLALVAGTASARSIVDGKLHVTPIKDNKFQVDNYKFGKVEFFGYVGDVVDSKKITGLVLLNGEKATDEQKHVISSTAKTQKINAFIEIDGKEQPLIDDRATTTPPPLDQQSPAPTTAPASH
ncbi:MAG TPA: hypothetical protein VF132_14535 [Rudaea sp.]